MFKYLPIIIISLVINLLIFVVAYSIIIPEQSTGYTGAWWTAKMTNVAFIPLFILVLTTLFKGLKTGLLTLVVSFTIFFGLSFVAKTVYFAQGCPVDQQAKSEIPISINLQEYKIDELIVNCKPWKGPEPSVPAYPEGFFGFIGGPTLDLKVTLIGVFYSLIIAAVLIFIGTIRNVLIKVHKWQNPTTK